MRYASVVQLAADIASYLDETPVTAYKENVLERFQRWGGQNTMIVSLVLAHIIMRSLLLLLRGV